MTNDVLGQSESLKIDTLAKMETSHVPSWDRWGRDRAEEFHVSPSHRPSAVLVRPNSNKESLLSPEYNRKVSHVEYLARVLKPGESRLRNSPAPCQAADPLYFPFSPEKSSKHMSPSNAAAAPKGLGLCLLSPGSSLSAATDLICFLSVHCSSPTRSKKHGGGEKLRYMFSTMVKKELFKKKIYC